MTILRPPFSALWLASLLACDPTCGTAAAPDSDQPGPDGALADVVVRDGARLDVVAIDLAGRDTPARDSAPGDAGAHDAARGDSALPPVDGGDIAGLALTLEQATPEQIGVHVAINRALDQASRVTVRFRGAQDATWREAHPLLRIRPDWIAGGAPVAPVDSFAGTIFDLVPGADYYVELTLAEPGQPDRALTTRASTRALPAPAGAVTRTATSSDDLQAIFDALGPGDVLELADGSYNVSGLHLAVSGAAAQPIHIRGQSRAGVVLHDSSGDVLQLQEVSHVVIENLTLQGSGTDSGTDASSRGVSFWNGAFQQDVTFRDLDIRGVDMGIVAWGDTRGILVYNCDLQGNNLWDAAYIQTNLTWNDDGIRLPGQGNCAFENTLHGFGDSFAVADGVHSAAVHFYRNRVRMTGDDGFEADYGTRNIGFYDNIITNSATFLSLDPVWGGPLYCFRNVSINALRGPFKLNNTNSGFMVYNNTIVRTEGTTTWGWVQYNNGDLRGWSYRNNLLIYRGASGNLLAIESGGNDPIDFTHNAWFPDGDIWWTGSGGSFASLAAAAAGLPATAPLFGSATARHAGDLITVSDPFTSAVTLGSDHLTEVTLVEPPALRDGLNVKHAGIAIPNVTDGYSGAAPDLGAVIAGRPLPRRGAQRP